MAKKVREKKKADFGLSEEVFLKILADNKGKANTLVVREVLKQPSSMVVNNAIRKMAKKLEEEGRITMDKSNRIAVYSLKE